MHRALTQPLDALSARNPEAIAARDWAIHTYLLFKRVKAARDVAVRLPTGRNAACVANVQRLVAQLRAHLEDGRDYHLDFKAHLHVLAVVHSPFFHAASWWAAMARFLEGFEGGSTTEHTKPDDGRPRVVPHVPGTRLSAPQPRTRIKRALSTSFVLVGDDSDECGDESIF
ncbi:unnamed protein product [Cutaneotrichosporon oleaginosum]